MNQPVQKQQGCLLCKTGCIHCDNRLKDAFDTARSFYSRVMRTRPCTSWDDLEHALQETLKELESEVEILEGAEPATTQVSKEVKGVRDQLSDTQTFRALCPHWPFNADALL